MGDASRLVLLPCTADAARSAAARVPAECAVALAWTVAVTPDEGSMTKSMSAPGLEVLATARPGGEEPLEP